MYAKKVKYKGFDGHDVEEVVRFNLTKAEVLNLDLKYEDYGGLMGYYRKMVTDIKDGDASWKPYVNFLQSVLLAAYGQRTEDGRFIKKKNGVSLAEEFETSEAYAAVLMPLLTEDGLAELEPMMLGIFPDMDEEQYEKGKEQVKADIGLSLVE